MRKRIIQVICACTISIFANACSAKTPEVWLPPDCNAACHAFHETLTTLSPIKCDKFVGMEKTQCLVHVNLNYRSNRLMEYGIQGMENDLVDRNKLENSEYYKAAGAFDTAFKDGTSKKDITSKLFEGIYETGLGAADIDNEGDSEMISGALSPILYTNIKIILPLLIKRWEEAEAYYRNGFELERLDRRSSNDLSESDKQHIEELKQKENALDKELGVLGDEIITSEATKDAYKDIKSEFGDILRIDDINDNFLDALAIRHAYDVSVLSLAKPEAKDTDLTTLEQIERLSELMFKVQLLNKYKKYHRYPIEGHFDVFFKHQFLSFTIYYAFKENKLPSSNAELFKIYTPNPIDESSETGKELFNIGNYLENHPFNDMKGFAFTPYFASGAKNGGCLLSNMIYGYVVDFTCQPIDLQLKNGKLKITHLAIDGKPNTQDDFSIEVDEKEIMEYVQKMRSEIRKSEIQENQHIAQPSPQAHIEESVQRPEPQTEPSDEQDHHDVSTAARYGVQFVRTITYKNRTAPSWIIFKDRMGRFCAIVTSSKYEILQENNYCIPFSGDDKDLTDSFASNRVATELFPDHKKCKNVPTVSDNPYCNNFYKAFEEMAEKEKFFSMYNICHLDNDLDDQFDELCSYLD